MAQRRAHRSSLALLAVTAGAALLLSGCTGGDAKKKKDEELGPLDTYLMALSPDEEMTQQKLDEQTLKVENLVAKCMAKEGFEYKPNPANGGFIGSDEGEEIDWSTVEFAEKYGYGFVDSPYMTGEEESGPEEMPADPNEDYTASLSETQYSAYQDALYGPPQEEPSDPEEVQEYDWKTAGCYGAAQHEVEGENAWQNAYEDPEFTDLFAAVDAHWQRIYGDGTQAPADPEVAKLNAKWSSCMTEAGLSEYTFPQDPQNQIMEESNQLNSGDGEEYTEPTAEQRDQLKKKEISIAVPDAKCRKKLHYEDELQKIDFASQEKFISEHKSELDALVAKHSTKTKKSS